jgi:hypothetical protein
MKAHLTLELALHCGDTLLIFNGTNKQRSKKLMYDRICWRKLNINLTSKDIEVI